MIKPPSKSIFRPLQGVDRAAYEAEQDIVGRIDRRNVLRGAMSLGALTFLTGCNVSEADQVQAALRGVSRWNDFAQAAIFRPGHLAPTYAESLVVKPPRFNAHYDVEDVKPVNANNWRLELSGRIADKRALRVDDIYAMPEQEMIIKHICIEGWDYIGQWSGVNLKYFLEKVGADLTAKYIAFRCADGYVEALDMPSALHPQTMLATKYAKEPMADPFGFPLRLRTATKIGFKNAKWITGIEVTNDRPETYYEKEGFNWFSGM